MNFNNSSTTSNKILFFEVFLFLLFCLIGGTTYAVQKIGLTNSLPFWSAANRFILAGFLLFIYLIINRKIVLNKTTIYTSLMYGVFYYCIPFGTIYWVGQFLPSGLLSVLSSSVAVFVLVFNALLKGEKTLRIQISGIVLSMMGIIIIFIHTLFFSVDKYSIIYICLSLIAYLGAALATVLLKKKIHMVDHASFNSLSLIIGGAILAIVSLIFEKGVRIFSGISLLSLLYLSIIGSIIAARINTYLTSRWHVAKVSTYRFISPVIALYIGFLLFFEKLSFNNYVGTIFILIGAWLINKQSKTKGI